MMKKMKLRNKILLPVIVILVVVVTAISTINYAIAKNAVTEMVDTEMEAAIGNVLAAERLSNEIIDLVMSELDGKNIALSEALAEIVRLDPHALETAEMTRLADMLDVTEVHVTDENGVLLWGNVPDYFGLDFASGEQTAPFLEILKDPSYTLAQEPQSNATTGNMFQYTGVARTDTKGLVQVGISAEIIDTIKESMGVQRTVANTRVGRTGFCFIIEDGKISASADVSQIGSDFAPVFGDTVNNRMWIQFDGETYYANALTEGNKTIYAVIPDTEFYEHLNTLGASSMGISVAALVIMSIIVIIVLGRITRPIEALNQKLVKAAAGDLDIIISSNARDEIEQLSSSMEKVLGVFNTLIDDIRIMSHKLNVEGEIDYSIDESRYNGDYKKVVSGLNEMIRLNNQSISDLIAVLQGFDSGNFDVAYPLLSGKKALSSTAVEELRKNLKDIEEEISTLSKAAIRGELSARADAAKYKGGWAKLLLALNTLVKSIADQANWYESLLDGIPAVVFSTDKEMNWTFINKACERMINKKRQELIGQPCCNFGTAICNTDNCAINNFKKGKAMTEFSQNGMHYQVNVAEITDEAGEKAGFVEVISDTTNLGDMVQRLNDLVNNIKQVSDQVTDGAKQIAESSQHLAEGAINQSGALEELNASIADINDKTQTNAQNAVSANELSDRAKGNALNGNEQMKRMLSAMEGIKTASDNIARIIKTIEDIAFQTNLLALNAAVEAARAGVHGKGFAIVAEEVRTLAARSQTAAKETNDLILESILSVEKGAAMADDTAQSLSTIVADFDRVSGIIEEITQASAEQAEATEQISQGIEQIANVTQQNSAASQEAASASEELVSQAEVLKNMVSDF